VRTAAALVIGNEILSGKTQDANTFALAKWLRKMGIKLSRTVSILDDIETIASEVRSLSATHDYLFTSGGVGPTHDDVTMEGVAAAFGVKVVSDPGLETMITKHYGERLREGHLRMAIVPEGSKQIASAEVWWPVTVMNNVFVLPGVPEIFRLKLTVVEQLVHADVPFLSRAVFTKMDEGTLKPLLDAIVEAYPDVDVGSYPSWTAPDYKTKLTFDGRDAARLEAAVQRFVATLPEGEPQRVE
jgi:molybdenum cofactor synthesis domain-containing protein